MPLQQRTALHGRTGSEDPSKYASVLLADGDDALTVGLHTGIINCRKSLELAHLVQCTRREYFNATPMGPPLPR